MTWVLISRYTAPRERIEELVPAHREYLRRHFAAGTFVVSGRRVPWTGGLIVAQGLTRAELDAVIAEDPFAQAGVAETEVVEFAPLFAARDSSGSSTDSSGSCHRVTRLVSP